MSRRRRAEGQLESVLLRSRTRACCSRARGGEREETWGAPGCSQIELTATAGARNPRSTPSPFPGCAKTRQA